ncbi:MAG: type II toxin-antitoxin system VapC family toxin [Anaerolineales bacterium]|nr:type II toxin-antitoxin system VapC family toxin [Anaerolineales bacterium]
MPVIDASVYIALTNAREKEHASSWAWFEGARLAQESLAAPSILLAEVAAALSRGVGDPALARRVVRDLRESGLIELVPVTLSTAELAAILAADHRIRGCDAVYVALAQQRNAALITLDGQQRERVPPHVLACTPAEALRRLGGG